MLKLRPLLSCLALAGIAVTALSLQASTPPSHDVTVPTTPGQTVVLEWTGVIPAGAVGAGTNSCDNGSGPLEDPHTINLTAPEGAYATVTVAGTFHIEWDTAGTDGVLSVIKDGATVASSDGGTPEENVVVNNPRSGVFQAIACAFAASANTPYRGKLTLTASAAAGVGSPPAGLGNASGAPPRFQHYTPDYAKDGFGMFGGEATLDVNVNTNSIFYIGFLETLRLKLNDLTSPAQQTWELGNTVASSVATSDPILVADRDTGRVFAMQLLLGPGTSAMDYTDDDGETWTPGMAGSPFRSGADHQGMDVGVYPTGGVPIPHPLYPNAVYYCSQDVADVYCSRSDDGGVTFKPSVVVYTILDCQGLHGHPKVAPDGAVYIPVSGCPSPLVDSANSQPAVAVSEDAGLTWEVRPITTTAPGTGGHGADPSIAFGADGTIYLSYVDSGTNHIHMVRSQDHGLTWDRDTDLGALAGITAAQFPAVVAGDADRAAVAFFGATYNGAGVDTAENYEGVWHLYVASTYDGGLTYHVTNATPGDPIQRGGVCGGGFCRNLLDFFDAVVDTEGRILVGYEDGCTGGCALGQPGTFSDQAVIARQSGGPRMLAAFDPVEPAKSGAPRIEGYRTANFVQLNWPQPDNGGAAITDYKVYRGSAAGATTFVAATGNKLSYADTTPAAGTAYYTVTAVNANGESAKGNELALAVGDNVPTPEAACVLPGLLAATDRVGEPEASPATRDVEKVFVAEPEDMPGMLVFTLQFAEAAPPNQGGGPPSRIFFYLPDGGLYIRLNVSGATGAGTYGHLAQNPDTGIHNTLFPLGDLDAGSGYINGGARMVIAKDKLGLKTGDLLRGVYALTLTPGAGSNITTEEAGYFDYKLVGNDFCELGGIIPPPPPLPVTPPATASTDNGRFGAGALSLALLSLLGLGSALRRRSA